MANTPVKTKTWKRFAIVLLSLIVGIAIVATFVSNKKPPQRVVAEEVARSVNVIEANHLPFNVKASGFGSANPSTIWTAVSNVKGHVIYRHEDLESGSILPKGTLLLETDPGFYELALAEADADIAGIDAEMAQSKQEQANVTALLELEQQRLDLAETELERTRVLVSSGAVSQTVFDTLLRSTLQQRQAVQSLENQQNIIPVQLVRLEAQKDRAFAKRALVELDLEDTKIFAPFDLRVSDVKVETHQYINPGQVLFSGDSIDTAEVILQVPMQDLRRVLTEVPSDGDELNIALLDAKVQLVDQSQTWDADVIRIANGIDPATRTVRVVLSITQPQDMENPHDNPPLPKGMYVEGALRIDSDPLLVIPQEAIHEGWVYLVDADNRLERRQVEVSFRQDDMAVILSGLDAGDIVILDDIVPAISGILLDPQRDAATEQALQVKAAGEAK